MSDYNCIDVIREAKTIIVAAAQSSTSFIPALGAEKTRILRLNLLSRMIFKAADEAGGWKAPIFLARERSSNEVGVFPAAQTTATSTSKTSTKSRLTNYGT